MNHPIQRESGKTFGQRPETFPTSAQFQNVASTPPYLASSL